LGGYAAAGGQVAWGRLYRSGDLADLPEETRAALEARRIRTIVDFRAPDERARVPDGAIATVRQNRSLPIDAGNIIDFYQARNAGDAERLMEELYRRLPGVVIPPYRALFRLLEARENAPLLFHCSAGKDRTGLAAALILTALGVDRETIIEDYLLSAECLRGKYDAFVADNPASEPFMTVRRNFITAALKAIDTGSGGMDYYLRKTLGVDVETLRDLYVEPAAGGGGRDGGFNAGSF
jgi:protein-tyrosine phosphatase